MPHLVTFCSDTDDDEAVGPSGRGLGVYLTPDTAHLDGDSFDLTNWRADRQAYQDRLDLLLDRVWAAFQLPWEAWESWESVLRHPRLTTPQRSALLELHQRAFSSHFPFSMFVHAALLRFHQGGVRARMHRMLLRCTRADLAHLAQCVGHDFRCESLDDAPEGQHLPEELIPAVIAHRRWPWRHACESLTVEQLAAIDAGVVTVVDV